MPMNRRAFVAHSAAAIAGLSALKPRWNPHGAAFARGALDPDIKIGACVVGLEQALQAGLEGVEVGVGGPADTLQIAKPETIKSYKEQMAKTGLPICSLMMGLLNECPLASDPRGPAWLEQSIDAAAQLNARVILVAFFGNGDLLGPDGKIKSNDVNVVIERLKSAAPKAASAGVVLAIENYLNAQQNARILNSIGHDAVKIYYDCYNTGASKGYDVPAEIRMLKDRIVQFHFKNGPDFLESGQVKFGPVAEAISDIGYKGWIVLETSSPSKDAVADARRNGTYAKSLFPADRPKQTPASR